MGTRGRETMFLGMFFVCVCREMCIDSENAIKPKHKKERNLQTQVANTKKREFLDFLFLSLFAFEREKFTKGRDPQKIDI